MKTYDLSIDIVQSLAGDGIIGYYSKGHHERVAFVNACKAEFGDEDEDILQPENVQLEYWRSVKASMETDFCEDPYARKFLKTQPGPGAFPVTHIELISWSR